MAKNQPKAIIIGAGVGGVSTAARLARAGFQVTVLEKNGYSGGRCSLIHHDGHRFDRGPSLYLLPHIFEEAFRDLGTSLEDQKIQLIKCEPNYKVHFSDGQNMHLSTDTAIMKKEVERFEGKDGFENYLGFLQEGHRHYEISVTEVLNRNFTSLLSMLRPSFISQVFTLHPFESVYSRASRYFHSDKLRKAFTFSSMYMGMSPINAPGTYSLLQYTELAEGIWYPIGGFHRVVQALVSIGERLGVKYRFSTPVRRVLIDESTKRAKGVELETGEKLFADLVIVNADLVYAYNNLLPPSSQAKRLAKKPTSCSSISFYWAMNRKVPTLSAHNIFLAAKYQESFDEIFDDHKLPEEPSFYVNVPSRVDPTAAPPNKDTIVVLVPVGHLTEPSSSVIAKKKVEEEVSRARDAIIATIEARTGETNLRSAIANELVNTPLTWKEELNLDRGAILGLSHSFFNVLSFRPRTRHPSYKSLYFVGASTHPGTGVPICLAGGKITSEQILENHGVEIPWARAVPGRLKLQKIIGPLDPWTIALLITMLLLFWVYPRVIN